MRAMIRDFLRNEIRPSKSIHLLIECTPQCRFRCRRCEFSANILNSLHTHYKIKHPEADQERPDFEERADDDEAKVFSHDFWKEEWGVPTLAERKAIVAARNNGDGAAAAAVVKGGKKRKKALPVVRVGSHF